MFHSQVFKRASGRLIDLKLSSIALHYKSSLRSWSEDRCRYDNPILGETARVEQRERGGGRENKKNGMRRKETEESIRVLATPNAQKWRILRILK